MEPTEGSETSDFENWTPGRYPKEANLHSRHGESLRTRIKEVYSQQCTAMHHSAGLQHLFTKLFVGRRSLWLSRKMSITNPKASNALFPVTARALSKHLIHELHYIWTDYSPFLPSLHSQCVKNR